MNGRTPLKVAYFCEPQIGGTFTFFRRLRPILAEHRIDFRCVSSISAGRFKGSRFEGAEGVDFIDLPEDLAQATGKLIEHVQHEKYQLAMVLPAADVLSSNLPSYLPHDIRCVMRVPMMTRGAYAPTQAVAPHLNAIYAVSDRIADDLTGRYQILREKIKIIYHGVDPNIFPESIDSKSSSGTLRLLYAGRLWDIDKGVFLLPDMMKELSSAGADVHLTVAGSGQDAEELKQRFKKAGVLDRVTMTGPVALDEMNALYRAADVFVFPSRFEGCGFAVLEAMSASCAAVVADIRGSLRVLVDNGKCGVLALVGDGSGFGRAVLELARDRTKLVELQHAARRRVIDRFTLKRMAAEYAESFRDILSAPENRAKPLSLRDYAIPDAFKPTWRTRIPRPLKNFARTWLERLGVST